MREDLIVPQEGEEYYASQHDTRVVTIPFSPLEVRMQKEKPVVFAKLQELKAVIGEEKFKRLVNRMHNINYADRRMLIVAESELHRTNINREILADIIKVFDVVDIRVVTQG